MFEEKLESAVNELLKNKNPKKNQLYLKNVGDLLLQTPYFKSFMEAYPDLGPLMYVNLLNSLKFKKYKPKTILWDYNDLIDGVYIIISGEVKIYSPPVPSSLIRCKNIQKNQKYFAENNTDKSISKIEKFTSLKEVKNSNFNVINFPLDFMEKRERIFGSNLYNTYNQLLKKKKKSLKMIKYASAKFRNNLTLQTKKYKNISKKELEITLTETNFILREPQEARKVDYIESYGKMIGEDDLLQELKYRRYACETLSKCILGFLSNKNYHLFFDKINRKKNSNIISFLYKVNYFNNKNNFIHKLCRAMRIKNYKKGTIIYKKNMPYLNMYLIKDGTVEISFVKLNKYSSELNSDLIIDEQNKNNNKSVSCNKSSNNFYHFIKERNFELKGEYFKKNLYTLVNYGEGELLGNIEYLYDINKYLYTAKCITDVVLFEIDIKAFNKIQKPYNIEFFIEKTKQQIKYLNKRVKEINLMHEKNDEDQYKSRNKFMKIFYQRNPPLSSLRIYNKYINNSKNPFPINIKIKNKKLINTRISPLCLYEFASHIINRKKQKSQNLFITNNIDYTKNFNKSPIKKTQRLIIDNKESEKNSFLYNNKYKINKEMSNIGSNSEKKIDKKSSYYRYTELNKLIANKNKSSFRQSHSTFNFKFLQNIGKSSEFTKAFINVYQKVQRDDLEKRKKKLTEKKYRIIKKREISSAIAFQGYRAYLPKNKKKQKKVEKDFFEIK